jgi:hypothetical protein
MRPDDLREVSIAIAEVPLRLRTKLTRNRRSTWIGTAITWSMPILR